MSLFRADTYGPWQFTVFRVVFGLYLAVHFFTLAPWAPEVFGPRGMIADPALLPAHGVFPNPLEALGTDAALAGAVLLLGLLAVAFAAGLARRIVALVLWFGWACLFHRNVFIANPSLPYVGWLLLACAALPSGEPLSLWPRRREGWRMDPWIFAGAWLLLGAGYTFSGLHKAASESWQNGLAIKYVLELPTTRDTWFKHLLLGMPDLVHRLNTWGALLLEILFLPLCLIRRARPWVFLAMLGMHTGILLTVSIADLTLGMFVFHLFVVEPDWGVDHKTRKVLAVDGLCGLCDRLIGFLVRADTERALRFMVTPTLVDRAHEAAVSPGRSPNDTDVEVLSYTRGDRTLTGSTAVVRAIADMGGVWQVALALLLVPRPLRDMAYGFVIRRRARFFSRSSSCRVPTPSEEPWFVQAAPRGEEPVPPAGTPSAARC